LFVARSINPTTPAFGSQARDIARNVENGTFLSQDGRCIGRWAGHVQAADLLVVAAVTGEIAESHELGCARSGHFDVIFFFS
jgi:hypothetical protein